jgi:type VI secretion system protein ImpH
MDATSGRPGIALSEQLLREGNRFDFFQAVRLLDLWARECAEQDPAGRRHGVGFDRAPDREVARFRVLQSLSFPAGPVHQIRTLPQPGRASGEMPALELVVTFLGLTGPNGVLPRYYTSLLIHRIRDRDYSARDFFDLFHHRFVSLFFRSWEKYRLPFAYERARISPDASDVDPCSEVLYCLVGLGTAHLRGRLKIEDDAFLYYSGHFAHRPRSAVALEALLSDYFERPIAVQQFQGQWLYLDPDDRSLMPNAEQPHGRNNQLGVNLVVGERVWDVQSKFRLRIGPLTYEQFRGFMPNGDALRPLAKMTRSFVGPEFDFDVQPVLLPREAPWCRLGGDERGGAFLGWNTWVRCNDFQHEVDNAIFGDDESQWSA